MEPLATDPPRTWLCVGERPGDNAQAEVLVDALGWPFERKQVICRPPWNRKKPRVRPTLDHVDLERSDPLEPPWPDLLVTVGRRLSMVALWVQERSGGRTRTVLLGKPSGMLERFDLIVCSAENPLPARPNVVAIDLPLMRIDEEALQAARERWSEIETLPRPVTAVLVGGPTRPFRFEPDDARELLRRAARDLGGEGTLWIATSPRTTPEIVAALREEAPDGARFYEWRRGDPDNPYRGLLARADRFVVTADSISMMVEVARLGRPLAIYPLDVVRKRWKARMRYRLAERLITIGEPDGVRIPAEPPSRPIGDLLYRFGLIRFERDFTAIHRALYRRGAAVPFGEPFPPGGSPVPDELEGALAAVRRLVDPVRTADALAGAGTGGRAPEGGNVGQG